MIPLTRGIQNTLNSERQEVELQLPGAGGSGRWGASVYNGYRVAGGEDEEVLFWRRMVLMVAEQRKCTLCQ